MRVPNPDPPIPNAAMEPSEYCRALETYLCRKNEGHLIRIVGPVFEQVCGWAAQGVPLTIACRGIDRYCERYYAKGPRRRPVRIEFCEADILELFDDWRRAVGVGASDAGPDRRDTLPTHLDRAIARLTTLRAGPARSTRFDENVAAITRELDAMRSGARQARGDTRTLLLEQLAALDRRLIEAASEELRGRRAALEEEARAEIAPFALRMTKEAHAQAVRVALDRAIRDALGLPVIAFE
jgi:hypothetical protein